MIYKSKNKSSNTLKILRFFCIEIKMHQLKKTNTVFIYLIQYTVYNTKYMSSDFNNLKVVIYKTNVVGSYLKHYIKFKIKISQLLKIS